MLDDIMRAPPGEHPLTISCIETAWLRHHDSGPRDGQTRPDPLRPARAIVAAAGAGTRFAGLTPKVITPGRLGVPLVVRVLSAVLGLDEEPIVVISQTTGPAVLRCIGDANLDVVPVIQEETLPGMGGAVLSALRRIPRMPTDVVVVWADMGMIWAPNIWLSVALHQRLDSAMSFPTKLRSDPYVQVWRDSRGSPCDFRLRRHGDAMPGIGESDCGVFVFNTGALADALEAAAQDGQRTDQELELLPVVRNLAAAGLPRYAFHLAADDDSQGVNNTEELAKADDRYEAAMDRMKDVFATATTTDAFASAIRLHGVPPPLRISVNEQAREVGLPGVDLPPAMRPGRGSGMTDPGKP
jgi:bifunctional N-acetylglucosamine-1-phosphate-uridyltransferase/glucosamine-1-phosphate-acetyltransferase GlmU-like protein